MNRYIPACPELVEARGNSNGITLDGSINEYIHLKKEKSVDGTNKDYPACYNGAYNLLWTKAKKAVTCPVCLQRI
jgi:hypothetical protein